MSMAAWWLHHSTPACIPSTVKAQQTVCIRGDGQSALSTSGQAELPQALGMICYPVPWHPSIEALKELLAACTQHPTSRYGSVQAQGGWLVW